VASVGDLSPERCNLALDGALLLLPVRTHASRRAQLLFCALPLRVGHTSSQIVGRMHGDRRQVGASLNRFHKSPTLSNWNQRRTKIQRKSQVRASWLSSERKRTHQLANGLFVVKVRYVSGCAGLRRGAQSCVEHQLFVPLPRSALFASHDKRSKRKKIKIHKLQKCKIAKIKILKSSFESMRRTRFSKITRFDLRVRKIRRCAPQLRGAVLPHPCLLHPSLQTTPA
jgi:hypothetical protein